MNKRIEELAEQVHFTKDKYGLYWDENANNDGVDLEKFAELIVKECAGLLRKEAESNYDEGTDSFNALMREAAWMKEYFGVE